MPALLTFLGRHAAIGFAIAVLFVGSLVLLDVAHLGTLVRTSSEGTLAVIVLTLACTITFSSAQMGFAVMLLGEENDQGPRGRRFPLRRLRPIPVKVEAAVRPARRVRD